MTKNTVITISFGDGIGAEVMYVTLNVLRHAMVPISTQTVEIGQRAYHHGFRYGIPAYCMDRIMENKILLMAPHAPAPSAEFETLDMAAYLHCGTQYHSQFDGTCLAIPPNINMQATAYIGKDYAIFSPNHGYQAGTPNDNTANPSGMILAAILMLYYMGYEDKALLIQNAWLKTLEDGYRTVDIDDPNSRYHIFVGTTEFSEEVIKRLGQVPAQLAAINYLDYFLLPKLAGE